MEKFVSTKIVENTLAKSDIHERWIDDYFSDENKSFYLSAFTYLYRELNIPVGAHILDVGCGSGTHSITLAKMGFYVTGIDYSEHVLDIAKTNVEKAGLQNKITLMHNNILQLVNLPEFDYVLCWGVLMHIPEYEKALVQLSNHVKPGGTLIISEVNMQSLESRLQRFLNTLRGKKNHFSKKEYGVEQWWNSPSGKIIVRHINVSWLQEFYKKQNLQFIKRIPGQFTESYTVISNKLLLKLIYGINSLMFGYIKYHLFLSGTSLYLKRLKINCSE